jgi:hypothetical protein
MEIRLKWSGPRQPRQTPVAFAALEMSIYVNIMHGMPQQI